MVRCARLLELPPSGTFDGPAITSWRDRFHLERLDPRGMARIVSVAGTGKIRLRERF
jgi:hypothetical protein